MTYKQSKKLESRPRALNQTRPARRKAERGPEMTRYCRRGRDGHDALFDWTTAGDIQPGEVRDNPLTRHCPRANGGCGSPSMQPCTRISRGRGAVRMTGYHDARRAPVDHEGPADRPSTLVGAPGDRDR